MGGRRPAVVGSVLLLALALAGCGDVAGGPGTGAPIVVVTHSILGDAVGRVVGDEATLEVVMPLGSDPHDFEPSARQATTIREADALIANGLGFEAGLLDAVEAAEDDGVPTFEASTVVEGETSDPHWFTDPLLMADVVDAMAAFLVEEVDGLDVEVLRTNAAAYAEELRALTDELTDILSVVPDDRRVLVTNHEVFAYFAERFDFEVVGAVIPGGTTQAEASAGGLADLADLIEAEGVPAIFGETDRPAVVAESLADEVGGEVQIVELFTESLGEEGSGGETYVQLLRTDAERIAAALGE